MSFFALFAALIVAAAAFGTYAAWQATERTAVRDAASDAGYAAEQAAAAIDLALRGASDAVKTSAQSPAVIDAVAAPAGCSLTFTGVGPFPDGHLDIVGPDGLVLCTSATPGTTYPIATWLAEASKRGVVAEPKVDVLNGRTAIVVAAAMPGGIGYVVGFLDLDTLGPGLSDLFSGRRGLEILVEGLQDHRIVSRSVDAAKWSGVPVAQTLFAGSNGSGTHRDVDGVSRIYASRSTSEVGFTVYAGAPRAAALDAGTSDFRLVLLVVAGSLLVILSLFVLIYRRIVGPIRLLSRSARAQRTRGEISAVPVVGPREVATVAEEFNGVIRELAESEQTYRVLFEGSPQPMWVWSLATGRFLAVNQAAIDRYGYTRQQFLRLKIDDVLPGNSSDDIDQARAFSDDGFGAVSQFGVWKHIDADERVFSVEVTSHNLSYLGEGARFTVVVDVTERQEHERQLRHLALHDELTGLANRTLVLDRLMTALHATPRTRVAVLYLDIDRFKLINEAHGHDEGDGVLTTVAERLAMAFRKNESIGRTGSDEFIVVCPLLTETAVSMASRIEGMFAQAVNIAGVPTFLTASVGISISSEGTNAEHLVRDAMTAMHRAKEKGGDRFEIFDERVRARTLERLEINNELHRAIELDELCLQFQPEINLATRRCQGFEALVRWNHPTRGLLAPAHFIELAEETGFIVQIGAWVLNAACRQGAEWISSGTDPGTISVNLSARELAQPSLVTQVSSALDRSGLPPSRLCLEITETSLMEDPDGAVGVLASLRDLGVKLSIDDFGTGYSSLVYLRKYRVDYLKVDRTFVSGLGIDAQSEAIVTSVIQLAHAFKLSVVAEGVETLEQATILTQMGCDLGQGYLWARPAWPIDVPALCGALPLPASDLTPASGQW